MALVNGRQRDRDSEESAGRGFVGADDTGARIAAAERGKYFIIRRLLAELLGTFALVTVAAGAPTVGAATGQSMGSAAEVIAPGLLVMAMIYTLGPLSGAHFNPSVTLAFALRGNFPWHRVPGYWVAQLVGAVLAALLLRAMFGTAGGLGATVPRHGSYTALVMEIVLTYFLLTVILATAANYRIVGHNSAIAVGGTIAFDGILGAPVSGASMNPARSFGPAVVSGSVHDLWIYVVGPVAGAVLAVAAAWLLRGPASPHADVAASGDT